MKEIVWQYCRLIRLDKPVGSILLLWPTLWALWLAGARWHEWKIVLIFVLGVFVMRSAGCIINDFADRKIDKFVERTRHRPLTSGKVSVHGALILFAALLVLAFSLVCFLNPFTIELAFVGAGLAVLYPFLKRITHLPQAGLGLAYSWSVPMAFAAVQNQIPWAGWMIFFATVLWVIMYDTLYAMVDRDDDKKIGVKSTAILFEKKDRLIIGVLQFAFLFLLFVAAAQFSLNGLFNFSLLFAALLFCYQQYLIRNRARDACFKAFLNNQWVGLVIFAGIFLA